MDLLSDQLDLLLDIFNKLPITPYCYIDKLPDVLLEEIFLKFLSDFPSYSVLVHYNLPTMKFPYSRESLVPPIGLVCHRWRDLLFSPKLWHRVNIQLPWKGRYPHDFYPILYRMAPAISILEVGGSAYEENRIFTKFPTFHNVKKLTIDLGHFLTAMQYDLIVELFPSVEKFNLYGDLVHFGDKSLQLFAAGWKNLVEIDFPMSNVTGAGMIQFVTTANRLQSIDIDGLTDSEVDVIIKLLSNSLQSISGDLSQLAVQSILKNCPQLQNISVYTPININPLKDLVNLRSLSFTFTTAATFYEAFNDRFCRPFGQLLSLQVGGAQKLTNSHLEQIAKRCPLVEIFSLLVENGEPNRFVTDSGMDQIVNGCSNLTQLVLNKFPLLTGSSFTREKLPKLTILSLFGCPKVNREALRTEFSGIRGLRIKVENVILSLH